MEGHSTQSIHEHKGIRPDRQSVILGRIDLTPVMIQEQKRVNLADQARR
jgi:hypothetical protein